MDFRLGDSELAQLFARLDVTEEWTLGFMAAIASGPETIPAETWLPYVAATDKFGDDAAAESNLATLAKLYNAVSLQIRHAAADVSPDPEDVRAVTEYCSGYVRGAKLHRRWLADEQGVARLRVMSALAGESDDPPSDEWKKAERARLGGYVSELFAHFRPKQKPVEAAPRIGRNDPCPCGSGKKYKKCCGKSAA
jgi:uncharacterized protein